MEVRSITYFEEPGPHNTEETFRLARERATELGIEQVVIASDTGKTALKAASFFRPDFALFVVTNPQGMSIPIQMLHEHYPRSRALKQKLKEGGIEELPASVDQEAIAQLQKQDVEVSPIGWEAIGRFHRGSYESLERVGVGVRVCLNIATWAVLSGKIDRQQPMVALAGTGFAGGGSDTATVIRPGATFEEWNIEEILCLPRR